MFCAMLFKIAAMSLKMGCEFIDKHDNLQTNIFPLNFRRRKIHAVLQLILLVWRNKTQVNDI